MPSPPASTRRRLVAPVAIAIAGAVALAGCGESADTTRGRQLFISRCGTCHVLSEAATTGVQGPNLDAAFADARAAGMDADTIEGIVKVQVENPRPSTPNPSVSMPADLVSGQDLDDVAAYVGSVAGVPGIKPPTAPGGPGGQVFAANGCGGCHTLAAANATGTVGPDLDQYIPGQSAAAISKEITDPQASYAKGYEGNNAMPTTFGTDISPQDLKLLVQFLIDNAGKKSG